jgi:AraC-like DNA-binding protein
MEEREKLRSLMQPCEPYREAACKARLLAVLLPLARRFQDAEMLRWQFERQRERAERFSKLLDHVQRHSAQKLPLNSAARLCGMSPAQFTRSFKLVAGMSYLAYVTHVRLAEAARLLRVGNMSIAEVADVTGFADQSHFDRRFKRAFGMTPRQFQQRPA